MTLFRFLFILVFSSALCTFSTAADPKDSSGTVNEAVKVSPVTATLDEKLILDEGGATTGPDVVAQENKSPEKKPPAQESPKSEKAMAGNRQKGAAIKAADSAQGKPSQTEQKPATDSASVKKTPAPAGDFGTKDGSITTIDEELILDGGEESILGQEKSSPPKSTAVAQKDTTRRDSAQADSAAPAEPAAASDSSAPLIARPVLDTAHTGKTGAAAAHTPAPLPEKTKNIEKVRAINFAANLKEYRSPKLAMLLSFILPGSGQVYAQSNLMAAGFAVLEAVVFGAGYSFMAKSKRQRKEARAYADSLYDPVRFETYLDSLRGYLESEYGSEKGDSIYRTIFFSDSSDERFFDDARSRNDNYYEDISSQSSPFARGWEDVDPPFTREGGFSDVDTNKYRALTGDTAYLVYSKEQQTVAFGFSSYQERYIDLVAESQGTARIGRNFYMSLLINHIASAVIAGMVAKKHNDALLGRESVWRRIDVEQKPVYTGSHTVNGYAVGVRF
ncbi:MAG: hypothetical protein JW768_13605 [Chitinispirillaceae bacterium]|nr:hypothetical protein [Chitinispirillaceae bacterium]